MPLTPEELEDNKQRREFWYRLITTILTTVLTSLPGLMAAYYGYANNSKLQETEVKIDAAHETTREAVNTATVAANKATTAAVQAKVAAEETKTAVTSMAPTQSAPP